MAARDTLFTTVRTEGGLLPPDLLERIASGEGLDGLDPEDYGLETGERLNEAISGAWNRAQATGPPGRPRWRVRAGRA